MEPIDSGTIRYIRCSSCGYPNPATGTKCVQCGATLEDEEPVPPRQPSQPKPVPQVMCPKCRKPFPAGSKFCGYCGTPLPAVPPAAVKPVERASPPQVVKSPAKPVVQHTIPPPTPPPTKAVPTPKSPAAPAGMAPAASRPAALKSEAPTSPIPVPAVPAQAPPAASPEGTVVFTGFHTRQIEASIVEKNPDGSTGKGFLVVKQILIGRAECDVSYPQDALLAARHAVVSLREGKVYLKDLGGSNGTFVRQRQDMELTPGDVFVLGHAVFRFSTQNLDEASSTGPTQGTLMWAGAPKLQRGPISAKLEHIQVTGEAIEEFKLDKPETTIGRTTGEIVFEDDKYMSGSHARIVAQPARFILQDLHSRNGVWRRLRAECELQEGDEFFLGEKIFRVSVKEIE